MHYGFKLFDFHVPYELALLFGALISATDPVAVLALFKDYGAPRRLSLIFEGESLFNDGTAVALFFVLLEVITDGFHGVSSVVEGIVLFSAMVFGGIAFGAVMGILFSKFIMYMRSNEAVTIMLMFVLSHITFLLSELLSEHMTLFGFEFKFSSIIATLLASMVVGNYGRTKISPRAEEFVEKFWGQAVFIANSLVFLLIGLLFATIPIHLSDFIYPILGTVVLVAIGRALSVYPVIKFLNWTKTEKEIPSSWQHMLAWGSLRGALAVMVVLIIPDNLSFPGWQATYSPKDFIMAITLGCIFATLFIKATTIAGLMKKLNIGALTDIEKELRENSLSVIHKKVMSKLSEMKDSGHVSQDIYSRLFGKHEAAYKRATAAKTVLEEHPGHAGITRQLLEITAIAEEKQALKILFTYGEISEPVYRKILNKLTIQLEAAELGNTRIDRAVELDNKNVIEKLVKFVDKFWPKPDQAAVTKEQYSYYRAQTIIARKAMLVLHKLISESNLFNKNQAAEVLRIYENFRENSEKRMMQIASKYPDYVKSVDESLAKKGLFKTQELSLNEQKERGMLTPKLYLEIKDEFEKESLA
jgi:CPA1 family monovalent cation:H+ antiporter